MTNPVNDLILNTIGNIKPFDNLEQQHISETRAWIESGAPLFRVQKPDVPKKHLVSYFILFDEEALNVLLVDHKKAQLWLPTGGHVEVDEDPQETVRRECLEEVSIHADFWVEEAPFSDVDADGRAHGRTHRCESLVRLAGEFSGDL